ncbi:MAG: SDR family NAD(P)-dependent oxidoreductase [Steroidobacteraceae bacterium]
MSQLNGKVALILGASTRGGIGEAIAKAYARAGAKIVLSARRLEDAEQIAREVDGKKAHRYDITREEDIAALVGATLDDYGRLDIAVDVAGGHASEPFDTLTPETLCKLLMRAFGRNIVEDLRPFARETIRRVLDQAAARREVEFVNDVARAITGRVILLCPKTISLACPNGRPISTMASARHSRLPQRSTQTQPHGAFPITAAARARRCRPAQRG